MINNNQQKIKLLKLMELLRQETDELLELSRYVQSEIPQNLRFEENALDLRSGA